MEKDRKSPALSKSLPKGSGSDPLSQEERALWEQAARDLKPLKAKKARLHAAHDGEADGHLGRSRQADNHTRAEHSHDRAQRPSLSATATAKTVPPLSELDRRKARKIGSGKIDIEARIDLHGMRQNQAHAALRRFLLQAHANDRRWVLVITGKGGAARRSLSEPDYADMHTATEPGVLRRNVPHWLAEPELRVIVVSYTAAAARHGGEGALYVQLRKRARPNEDA